MVIADDCDFLFQRGCDMHALRCPCVHGNGAGWRLLQEDGRDPSKVANAGVQPDWTRYLGGGAHHQWTLRSTLHVRDLRHGAVVHADGDRAVLAALEEAGHSASL